MGRFHNRPVDIESWALTIQKIVQLETDQFSPGSSPLQKSINEILQQLKECMWHNQPRQVFPSRFKKYLPFGLNRLLGQLFLRTFNVLFRGQRILNDLLITNFEKSLHHISQLDSELQLTKKELHKLQSKYKDLEIKPNLTPVNCEVE